ncbi:MAG: AMP-binding protein, partial [Alphaproteobacteria bacterium]|nr:AMP-binding protein [Alphaproteobacteria bacterium]
MDLRQSKFLRGKIVEASGAQERWLWGRRGAVALSSFAAKTYLHGPDPAGRKVLLLCDDQLTATAGLIELDGIADSILVCPPDLKDEHLLAVSRAAGIDMAVGTPSVLVRAHALGVPSVELRIEQPLDRRGAGTPLRQTAWLLLTSGTSGVPKIVQHDLNTLTAAFAAARPDQTVWSTFYDIRRYGGMQILLRALVGGGSIVLSDAGEPPAAYLARVAEHRVTHISGTPSHWRRAIMSADTHVIEPRYVRMSGEIADQAIIDALKSAFPSAAVAHAYASTEAGVGFPVDDGREGFPAAYLDAPKNGVTLKVVDGTLRLKSAGTAKGYIGPAPGPLLDAAGFVDSGDVIEQRGDRCYFAGRRGGIINVGGLKVHPEEVEAVLNRHAGV